MVKSTKPWPEDSTSEPAETPSGVYYVVVVDDNQSKKPFRRRDYTHFVRLNAFPSTIPDGGLGWLLSDTPTLFNNKDDARELYSRVDSLKHETMDVSIKTFRVTQSDWFAGHTNDANCRVRDARRIVSGLMYYDDIAGQVKKLAGKVLTILDAAYVNENQNKAVKDLVKSSFKSQLSDMWKTAYEDPDDSCCQSEGGTSEKDILD